jgi:predicted PurR-regulated permease PerM
MTVGYLLVDIPHALILGLLTAIACLLPALGSALVWVPVAIALAISHRSVDLAVIVGMGMFVGVIDNFVRPMLSRYGKLRLPVFLLFIAMLGGVQWAGTWGLVLGPLLVRLTVEALDVLRDQLARTRQAPASDALEH